MSENGSVDLTLVGVRENRTIPLAALYPHEQNYRSHPPDQLRKLKESLKRWGQVRSIVVKDAGNGSYTIVAGHGIFEAAQALHLKELRADVFPSWATEASIRAYLVADNKLGEGARVDDERLLSLIKEQADMGSNLLSVGSSEEELQQLLRSVANTHAGDFLRDAFSPSHPSRPPSEEDTDDEPRGGPYQASFTAPGSSSVSEDIQWFPVTYTVTQEQRSTLLEAIKVAKVFYGVETSAEALVKISEHFVNGHRGA